MGDPRSDAVGVVTHEGVPWIMGGNNEMDRPLHTSEMWNTTEEGAQHIWQLGPGNERRLTCKGRKERVIRLCDT